MSNPLQDFKDALSVAATGRTKAEAHEKDICIKCGELWWTRTRSEAAKREYLISGYCEDCWDEIFAERES